MEDKRSKEEELFQHYVNELLESGLLLDAEYEPETFILAEPVSMPCMIQMATKVKDKSIHVLHKHSYTPDWKLTWNVAGITYLCWQRYEYVTFKGANRPYNPFFCDSDGISYVDVKGAVKQAFIGASNSSAITFPLNQKWMYEKYKIFVQKTIISLKEGSLFEKTFTPEKVVEEEIYVKGGKWGKRGGTKLKYNPITLEEYIYNETT
jgi:hypothetical protein